MRVLGDGLPCVLRCVRGVASSRCSRRVDARSVRVDAYVSYRRRVVVRFSRRSSQMPPPAKEIKHHPTSVNDLLVRQLIEQTPRLALKRFLQTQLSCINAALAARLIGAYFGRLSLWTSLLSHMVVEGVPSAAVNSGCAVRLCGVVSGAWHWLLRVGCRV